VKTNFNKRKIINDPVHGFLNIPDEIIFDLIEHPYFQRLGRIKQLGLTHLVYPGAHHTRFHHCIGSMHLMREALHVLRSKGHTITEEEEVSACIAILLHDIGHGPFSHTLETSIVHQVTHEDISEILMEQLNKEFNHQLDTAIQIFQNNYPKRFLHQLVSSQLDVDRLDYLKRDSFFTGVSEGVIGTERIIKMMNVANDELVIENKGIYSIEKFIIARRLMYWQVYLHKTVISAEKLLVKILKRAKELSLNGTDLFASPAFSYFLKNKIDKDSFYSQTETIANFVQLDDYDIMGAIKAWCNAKDPVLSSLSKMLIHRKLYRTEIQTEKFSKSYTDHIINNTQEHLQIPDKDIDYYVFSDLISNNAYKPDYDRIGILQKDGSVVDFANASDQLTIDVLAKTVKKHFICYPKIK